MKQCMRLTALALAAVLCVTALAGCTEEEEHFALSVSVGGAPETLDPIYAVSETDRTVLVHLYENLMRTTVSAAGETTVSSGMAKSAEETNNKDGTVTWTFKLRSAKWSDGRSVTAADFVYAWQRLADPVCQSPNATLLSMVAGYDAARESGDMSLLQVTAKNDSTLVVVLNGTCEWFLSEVCTAPATSPLRQDVVQALKEEAQAAFDAANTGAETAGDPDRGEGGTPAPWWSDPAKLVTNGAYTASALAADSLTLTASSRYTGTVGPGQLTFRFAEAPADAWSLYEGGTADFVWPLTEEQLAQTPEQYQARTLATETVLYNGAVEPFSDPLVRQALCMAIDRNAVSALAGPTAQPAGGLVPDAVPENDGETFRQVGGDLLDSDPDHYADRCAQAKELLSQAGYDSGLDIHTLTYLYVDEGSNAAVARALADTWYDVLHVRVEPVAVTEQELEEALRAGDYTMAAMTVTALANDAESFLSQWGSQNTSNVVSYANSAYDTLLSIIATASDSTARYGCLHDAEVLLLEDSVLSPLYTTGTGWRLRETFTGVSRDARGWFSFTGVTQRVP